MTQLNHSPAPWHFHNTTLRSVRGDVLIFEEGTVDGMLAQSAPDMLATLQRVQGWLFTDLLHPDRPLNKDSAGKALQEINGLVNSILEAKE